MNQDQPKTSSLLSVLSYNPENEVKINKAALIHFSKNRGQIAAALIKELFPDLNDKKVNNKDSEISEFGFKSFKNLVLAKNPITYEIFTETSLMKIGLPSNAIQIRSGGTYQNKGFYLDNSVSWKIETDSSSYKVLVPR